MTFTYDIYDKLEKSQLFLANPQKKYLGILSGVKELKFKQYFNSLFEMSFKIYEFENGIYNEFYDKIEIKRLIEMQYITWFQIKKVSDKQDENSKIKYKEVVCLSLDNELISKKIDNIDGVYALYDVTDTAKSLLHIITKYCNWSIGHVDNELIGKWRTFSIDSERIYNLLTTDIAKSFDCVFQFDTYAKTINAYKLSNAGKLTNITISNQNVLKDYVRESDLDKIITKIRVKGATGSDGLQLDIRAVNPDGSDSLMNVSYYMTTDWMTQGLIDALNTYKTKLNTYSTQYTTSLNLLKQYQTDLTTLNTGLKDLTSQYEAADKLCGTYVSLLGRVPKSSDLVYSAYQTALTQKNSYATQITSKKSAIVAKETQITNTQTALNNISTVLSPATNFTTDQLNELDSFIVQGDDYEDDTFVATDTMTNQEIIDMKLELRDNANNELLRVSRPQYTISTTINNLFTIQDDHDSHISYKEWRDDCVCGNLITLLFRDDYWVTVRLMSMEFDFDNLSDVTLTFSDKSRLDDELIQLGEILAQADRTSSSFSLSHYGYDQASKQTSSVRDFMNSALNATTNRVISDSNIQTEFGQYGIINRKWLDGQNKYDDHQSWLTQNILLFTDDAWKSSKTGIGFFTNASGETFYGVIADVIVGNFVLTSALTISNSNNTITMNKDGATFTNCNVTINRGVNTLTLNATDGIKLTRSGVPQFYIDTNGNAVFNGTLGANSINADMINALSIVATSVKSSWVYAGNISASQLTAGTITGVTISGNTITGGTISGTNISGSTLTSFGYASLNTPQKTLIENGVITTNAVYVRPINSTTQDFSPDSSGYVLINALEIILTRDGRSTGFYASRNGTVTLSTINGYTPLHMGNYSGYCVKIENYHTNQIEPNLTSEYNIGFKGKNAASVTWVNDNFQPKSTSDMRLKKNILSLDLPDELIMSLKPKLYEYKCDNYYPNKTFGFLAQEVESAFKSFGLDPYEYNLIDKMNIRSYTDEGQYVDDYIHRLNYENFHAIEILIIQRLYARVQELEQITKNIQ